MNPTSKEVPITLALTAQRQREAAAKLSASDMADFLRQLAIMFEKPPAANAALRDALDKLGRLLRTYSDCDLDELVAGLEYAPRRRKDKRSGHPSAIANVDLATLDLNALKGLLRNPNLTRADLIRIASERFGIPKWRLARQKRDAAVEAVEAALANVEALDIISEEARRAGSRRSS